jgi:hypothetical protein
VQSLKGNNVYLEIRGEIFIESWFPNSLLPDANPNPLG